MIAVESLGPLVPGPAAAGTVPLAANNNLDLVRFADRLWLALRTPPSHFASAEARLEVSSAPGPEGPWRHEATVALGGVRLDRSTPSARAVLVTAVGEVPGVVPDGGGIVVAPGDPAALADGLRRLASSPEVRLRMGTALRESVGARFSIEALTEGTLAVYEAAIAGRPVAAG